MDLARKWRPRLWRQVVGQEKAVAVLRRLARRGLGGRALWITGQSGTGKTTLALLSAREVADEHCITEMDAGELTTTRLAEIEGEMRMFGLGRKAGRAYIVNEAHGLKPAVIRRLLVVLERLPAHVLWVFTTTVEAQGAIFEQRIDAAPLLSRCTIVPLARRNLAKPFARRAKAIARIEQLDGRPLTVYYRAVQLARNNLRAVLQQVEAGAFGAA